MSSFPVIAIAAETSSTESLAACAGVKKTKKAKANREINFGDGL